jgi:hypothetical protein
MLPKINHPTYEFIIPSTQTKELFRPFLVKEEKVLLMAKSSEESTEIFRAVKQNVNNCAIRNDFDIDKLTIFDLEYLFLQLRAVSVNNIATVSYKDSEDNKVYDFEIDLKTITVQFPENIDKTIKINEDVGLVMKYPSASLLNDVEFLKSGEESMFELVIRCIDKIYDADTVYDLANYTKEDIESFLDDIGIDNFKKIQDFMESMPKLSYTIEYTNSLNNARKIELNSLSDFFTLG